MSTYSIKLKDVIDFYGKTEVLSWFTSYDLKDFLNDKQIDTIIKAGIWSKEKLANKILNHFLMREIGFETVSLFKHNAITFLNEIMEKYLPIIYTNSIEYDLFEAVNFTTEESRKIDGEASRLF